MRSAEVVQVLGLRYHEEVARLRDRVGLTAPVGQGNRHSWSPGDALAMHIVRELGRAQQGSAESKWAEGARKCGEAVDNGYCPAYLVTRGGPENVVVIETENPKQTDEMLGELLLQASDAGAAVRVVKLRTIVRKLEPWIRELVDA